MNLLTLIEVPGPTSDLMRDEYMQGEWHSTWFTTENVQKKKCRNKGKILILKREIQTSGSIKRIIKNKKKDVKTVKI